MSGAAMMKEIMEGGSSPGYLLAEKLKDLQAYCSANEKSLAKYFEHDGEGYYEWLKDFITKTLEQIEATEDDDQDEDYDDDD